MAQVGQGIQGRLGRGGAGIKQPEATPRQPGSSQRRVQGQGLGEVDVGLGRVAEGGFAAAEAVVEVGGYAAGLGLGLREGLAVFGAGSGVVMVDVLVELGLTAQGGRVAGPEVQRRFKIRVRRGPAALGVGQQAIGARAIRTLRFGSYVRFLW